MRATASALLRAAALVGGASPRGGAPHAARPRALASMAAEPPAIAAAITSARAQVDALAARLGAPPARLVAVSKTKPVALLLEAYGAGQRDFGENYVQEIVDKAPLLPDDVRWRFIGSLQSNKAKTLVHGVGRALVCVETVDRLKAAKALDAAVGSSARADAPLAIMLQINSSGEGSKAGCEPAEAAALAVQISRECAHLRLVGLMTIGAPRALGADEDDPDFVTLARTRAEVAAALGVAEASLELSMGMSGDWERAIRQGSTSVRVGSAIFGARG